MKKLLFIGIILVSLFVVSCASTSPDGYSKPTIFTSPISYLNDFPLNSVKKENLIIHLGLPDKSDEFEGKIYYSYEVGEDYGKREYIFEVTDDVITDVRYNDQGPYNGSSAKQIQNNK